MDADLRQFMKQYTYKMQGPTLRNVGKMMLKGIIISLGNEILSLIIAELFQNIINKFTFI